MILWGTMNIFNGQPFQIYVANLSPKPILLTKVWSSRTHLRLWTRLSTLKGKSRTLRNRRRTALVEAVVVLRQKLDKIAQQMQKGNERRSSKSELESETTELIAN